LTIRGSSWIQLRFLVEGGLAPGSGLNKASNMRGGILSVTSWTRRPWSRSYDEARQLETGAGSSVTARGVHGDSAPFDALLVGGPGLEREATDAPAEALAARERPPLSPGPGARASSRISPSWFSAVIRQTRRGAPATFALITTPGIDTQASGPTKKSMRAKTGRTKTEGLFSPPLVKN
jgi:hypothetical protein